MSQKTVFIAGVIGLLFGFLLTGTIGVSFFEDDQNDYDIPTNEEGTLRKDAEAFKVAYNLTSSIYIPITGETAYQKIEDGDTFILYAGRETCPFCQAYVPVLMDVAEDLNITDIYYVDTTDTLNQTFVNGENVVQTPTTFVYKDGVLVERIDGYETESNVLQLINDALE